MSRIPCLLRSAVVAGCASAVLVAPGRATGEDSVSAGTLLYDDFSGARPDARLWVSGGVEAAAAPAPLEPAGGPDGLLLPPGAVLTSVPIQPGLVGGVEVSMLVVAAGVSDSSWLSLEAGGESAGWIECGRLIGAMRAPGPFVLWTSYVPDSAINDGLRIRIQAGGEADRAEWTLAEIAVTTCAAPARLTVQSDPPGAAIAWSGEGPAVGLIDASAPDRRVAAGGEVQLAAPPCLGELVFQRWLVDGRPREPVAPALRMVVRGDTSVVAQYGPPTEEDRPVELFVGASIEDGVPLWYGVDAESAILPAPLDGALRASRTRELAIRAPWRVGPWVFERWRIDGSVYPAGRAVASAEPSGGAVWTAEYAILGDLNDDGALNKFDVDAFILALTDPRGYERAFPQAERVLRADINRDGELDERDVAPFVQRLLSD